MAEPHNHEHEHEHPHPDQKTKKKLLNKTERILLILALSILAIVILQNFGINMIETTEKVEISEERRAKTTEQASQEVNTLKRQ